MKLSYPYRLLALGVVLALSTPAVADKWQSLFDGKTLGRWEIVDDFDFKNHGKVEVSGGAILIGQGRPGSCVRLKGEFPRIDYEISLDAMRADGEDFFCGLTFPVGKSPCTLIVGGWGGPIVGLSCIDGEPAAENETCTHKTFDKGRWYNIRLRVTQKKIEAWIDGGKVVDFATKNRELTIWFEEESVMPLSIATWKTTAAVRNIHMRRIGAKHPACN